MDELLLRAVLEAIQGMGITLVLLYLLLQERQERQVAHKEHVRDLRKLAQSDHDTLDD